MVVEVLLTILSYSDEASDLDTMPQWSSLASSGPGKLYWAACLDKPARLASRPNIV
jgi:hypothetical protein